MLNHDTKDKVVSRIDTYESYISMYAPYISIRKPIPYTIILIYDAQ